MCCGCSQCGAMIANILYVSQRLATCFALTAVVGTIMLTLFTMLAVGVGLGYHYCVVEYKTYQLNLHEYQYTVHPDMTTSIAEVAVGRRRFIEGPVLIMPVNSNNLEFSQLIAKIRGMNRNVTVHFVADVNAPAAASSAQEPLLADSRNIYDSVSF